MSLAPPTWGALLYGSFVVKLTLPKNIKDLLDSYSFEGFPSLSLGNFLRNDYPYDGMGSHNALMESFYMSGKLLFNGR